MHTHKFYCWIISPSNVMLKSHSFGCVYLNMQREDTLHQLWRQWCAPCDHYNELHFSLFLTQSLSLQAFEDKQAIMTFMVF